ncbi:MAG: undecaprenyl/decaprenyl-phosphate alpha-N-acetylglucosaminyl 1-phosphate transferase [Ardenticatenaceae bacterium]|nr:undecaprenyl/decaprenyl-phosphate alpha-N-acetylglucosaminyl 1-phosphate transferase [Ardenticatenaceae bacterium]
MLRSTPMRTFPIIFLLALTITGFSTPWVRRAAIALGFVDEPARRKLHSTPMPLMGGVAIVAGFAIALLFFYGSLPRTVTAVLLASITIALIGLLDDRYDLPAWLKFTAEFGVVGLLLAFDIGVKLPLPAIVNYLITFIWIVGITNAINFLDNMDGLSAGLSAVSAAFILLLGSTGGQFLVSTLAAAILGSCLGFLRYNFKPAKIFMGDVGALFLGFLLAVIGLQLRFPENRSIITWMVPVFIMGVPIFDMSLVVFSRLRRGLNPMTTPGKDHISHRLVDLGFSQREAVLILYLLAGMLGMMGLFISEANAIEAYTLGTLVFLFAIYAIWWLEKQREGRAKT